MASARKHPGITTNLTTLVEVPSLHALSKLLVNELVENSGASTNNFIINNSGSSLFRVDGAGGC
jgi:hypothetical protein